MTTKYLITITFASYQWSQIERTYRNQWVTSIMVSSMDKLLQDLCAVKNKKLGGFSSFPVTILFQDFGTLIHLWYIWGKQAITPMARQAADLTEGTSSLRAALTYKDPHDINTEIRSPNSYLLQNQISWGYFRTYWRTYNEFLFVLG